MRKAGWKSRTPIVIVSATNNSQSDTRPDIMVVANADLEPLRRWVRIPIKSGYDVVWFSESVSAPNTRVHFVHSRKVTGFGVLNVALTKLRTVYRFILAYRKMRPRVVHIHWSVFPATLFFRHMENLILTPMGSDIIEPGRFRFRERLSRDSLSKAKVVTSRSDFMDAHMIALGVPRERLRRVTTGIDEGYFAAFGARADRRREMGISEGELVFFSMRALGPLYRVESVVSAFLRFRERAEQGLLLISEMGGDGNVERRLREMVRRRGASSSVRFLGDVPPAEMAKNYAVSDAVVSYADTDGMPQSLYEAMAAGCFPIFTDLPQYRELLRHKENGYLCSTSDPDDLVKAFDYARSLATRCWESRENHREIRRIADRDREEAKLLEIYRGLLITK